MRLFTPVFLTALAAIGSLSGFANGKSTQRCDSSSFSSLLGTQTIPGAEVVEVEAKELKKYHSASQHPRYQNAEIDACEVNVYYINPGTNSTRVTVSVWLPSSLEKWNGRYLGTGGGGWQCSMGKQSLNYAVSNGAAASTTDGGLRGEPFQTDYTLITPGNPDNFLLERLGHRAIHDMTLASKEVISQFFGRKPSSNYYMGCSTGGRQGLMEAARYPEDYDGILIGAPAALFPHFAVRLLAETAAMNKYNTYPNACEFEAIRQASIEECDHLDGRIDTIVARPDLCKFTAQKAVGRPFADTCESDGETKQVSYEAARVYQIALSGAFDNNGRYLGSGFDFGFEGTLAGICPLSVIVDKASGERTPVPFPFSRQYVEHYILKGLQKVDWKKVSLENVADWQEQSEREYLGIMEGSDDLSRFRDRGGKIMWYHGQEDPIIPTGVSYGKWDQIRQKMYPNLSFSEYVEQMQSFIKFYVVPGMSHCNPSPSRENGQAPFVDESTIDQLVQWVEQGNAPDRMHVSRVTDPVQREVCQWPQRPKYVDNASKLTCVDESLSVFGRLPPIADWPVRFISILPKYLFLSVKKSEGEF